MTNRLRTLPNLISLSTFGLALCLFIATGDPSVAKDRLVFTPPSGDAAKHVVLISGDEEYRTEESMPMLGKILSQKHGFKCTVLFALDKDGVIDPNNQKGLVGLSEVADADLIIIGTRFRTPSAADAKVITDYLAAGKPLIGIRTSTHAFRGKGSFGGISYDDFGLKVMGETWVSHHGKHKVQGARSHTTDAGKAHPILRGVGEIFCPSDVYGVIHLNDADEILLRASVTESLAPDSPDVDGDLNDPMQPFAWLHEYDTPGGSGTGTAFCTTGGASVDFCDEDLRRLIVNAAYHLTGREVPAKADVAYVDPFHPSFYGFIRTKGYWQDLGLRPEDFDLGKSTTSPDPKGSPEWDYRDQDAAPQNAASLDLRQNERIAFVGSSLAERMNLYGYFETILHTRFPEKKLLIRNFGWPADEVGNQQRPDNYTRIDDPLVEFGPETFVCFFGFNEHFAGDDADSISAFVDSYRQWIDKKSAEYSKPDRPAKFVLVSPMAVENANDPLLPDGKDRNAILAKYCDAIEKLAAELNAPYVDLFSRSQEAFAAQSGLQHTVNGIHADQNGYRLAAELLDNQLFPEAEPVSMNSSEFERIRQWVNDKSWLHLQDYRMLNGWYVYGGRRTWDTETFPGEYQKIRKMVAVRDAYIWDLAAGNAVPEQPDDSKTGEVFIPETMFGTRDDAFRENREPKTLTYPTPEESIAQMDVPEGFEVQLFASEADFPEFANPTQMTFDSQGRLWVSCMINYPQWLPGSAKPGDKLLIFEDTDKDGKADKCITFYDKLICPTGFEFYEDGVLVVDEPRIIFLRDTDGDDAADEMTQVIDGIATDDTHHAMGAWEWSHGGLLYMLEGVSMSTTLETPWGPFRNKGPSGAYVLDPKSWRFKHFRTPGYGNPWCMVFDKWGMGIIGDGTNAQQHWTSPLSGYAVSSRRTLRPVFNNEGMRPAVGNDFLYSRHFPDDMQGQFTYACVINMHGMPRFKLGDEDGTAGYAGERIEDLLASSDKFFRPVDPQIGPDGALWFGDWCNALIGHMQYSQRDPNRDHEHGRIYRLVNTGKPLIAPELQKGKSVPELLEQLTAHETRTRYRARRELRARGSKAVLPAANQWLGDSPSPQKLCEVLWLQESFRSLDESLVEILMDSDDFHARAAVVHSVANEYLRFAPAMDVMKLAAKDEHPRVRLEALRGLSYMQSAEAAEVALGVTELPMDYWLEYTLEHTLHALAPMADAAIKEGNFLAGAPEATKKYYETYKLSTGPGGRAVKPLAKAEDPKLSDWRRSEAIRELAGIRGGKASKGGIVFQRVCSACHQIGNVGKPFGPRLDNVGAQYSKEDIIRHILWPNEKIAKGYETLQVLTVDGEVFNGFVIKQSPASVTLGIATQDGKGKEITIAEEDIEVRKEMKNSSMPEGLVKTIAPGEFLDLIEYLNEQNTINIDKDGWIETGLQDVGDLRSSGKWKEISRDAKLKLGKNFSSQHSKFSNLLLSASSSGNREFAFHSPNRSSKSPSIQIRLAQSRELGVVEIENRTNSQFYARADGLTIWVSDDGEQWQKVWTAKEPAAKYSAELPSGTHGRYLKIGLEGDGILHLNQIVVYGE
ncbi:MAG TPA: cytochrome C [Planctomycetaceae bacterium]|nr:cytochrome C [Planctomycetaceae bacterium]